MMPVRRAARGAGLPTLDRHLQGGGGARRRSTPGRTFVNDVTALRARSRDGRAWSPTRAPTCCLMHMRGEPRTMQDDPRYDDVVSEVKAFLEERLAFAVRGGRRARSAIWLDPGIGFGKTVEHNLELLARLDEIVAIGRPVVVGASRKRFLGKLTGRPERRAAGGHDRGERDGLRARARRCSGCTTSPRPRDALGVAAATFALTTDDGRLRRPAIRARTRRITTPCESVRHGRDPGCRSTPTTASRTRSARPASGWCSTSPSRSSDCDATVTDRIEDTIDYGDGLPGGGAGRDRSAPTGRSSGSARRSPTCSRSASARPT